MWQLLENGGVSSKIHLVIKLLTRIEVLLLIILSINGIHSLRNGEIVESGHLCYVVSIWVYESSIYDYRCSGVILSESHILTAGHCVKDIKAYNLIIRASALGCTPLEQPVKFVDTIIPHPKTQSTTNTNKPTTEYWIHDIAILKLMCDLTLSLTLVAVGLDRRHYYQNNGGDCFIAGWAPMITNKTLHLVLSQAEARIFDSEMSQSNTFLLPNEIYAFLTQSPALIDDMDSGNALICGGRAVGIIVGGRDRTRSVMSVLTIAPYKDFINSAMRLDYGDSIG